MTLLETLTALTLSSMVMATGIAVVSAQARVANQATTRSESNDGKRAAALIIRAELAAIEPRRDVRSVASDSITTRVFRGVAIVCARRDSLTIVRYNGLRLPDAAKDSALQLGVDNSASIQRVLEQGSCLQRSNERILALVLSEPAPLGSMWLIFEIGSYQLHSYALRYRRGAENRQPITAEILDVRNSAFVFPRDTVLRSLSLRLQQRRAATTTTSSIRLLNAP